MDSQGLDLAGSIAATLDWWREAGVDSAFHDKPQRWLAEPESAPEVRGRLAAQPSPPAQAERPRIGGDPAGWPQDLAAFRRWWLEEPSLDPAGGPRVPPRGETGAALMALVPMPEDEDGETLLSARQGRLIAAMGEAMGIASDELTVASALPRHIVLPDWTALERDGLGDVLRHLIAVAAPQRLLVLGSDILPLLGHDPAQSSSAIQHLDIGGRRTPLLAGYAPVHLLQHARLRARMWRQWLDWTDEE
jgi:uracil-DNA glycosylase